jgi:hypothetical protein
VKGKDRVWLTRRADIAPTDHAPLAGEADFLSAPPAGDRLMLRLTAIASGQWSDSE